MDDEALVANLGAGSRKSLNMMLLAVAVAWKPSMLDEAIGVAVLTMQETFE